MVDTTLHIPPALLLNRLLKPRPRPLKVTHTRPAIANLMQARAKALMVDTTLHIPPALLLNRLLKPRPRKVKLPDLKKCLRDRCPFSGRFRRQGEEIEAH